ncbi:unnamed protein product [Rotaria sp. Silwood2]|nr:unnamed protein product [Rotaria sp. Silwood2]CAF4474732.1 unnamed protein product [Rotaria sp. Silwood2]
MKEQGETEANVRVLRSRTISLSIPKHRESSGSTPPAKICCHRHTASAFSSSSKIDLSIHQALPPQKKRHSGHRKIILSEQGKDLIRVEFHKLIQEKVYPTSEKLLKRLNEQYEDFPIRSASTLRKEIKSIGFIFQRTSKIKIPLDSQAFVAARAKYFQALEELREANVHLYYHDETWLNLREVKRLIWTLEGKGEIKKEEEKVRPRLAVSALISVKGYHIPSVDIWSCTEEHNMDSTHFLSWLDSTCATLRDEIGEKGRIAVCLDNATWHNTLTKESIIPKRSSTKGEIQKWLQDRKIHFPEKFVKAQLLQLVCANCPRKEYMSDRIAKKYAVEIIRLPKLYCSLNPIELSWNNLKQFVRDQNTTFRQDDMYKTADKIMEEEIEPHMQSDSEETDSEDDEENVEQ